MMTGIMRWDPFREITTLQNRMNRLFNEAQGEDSVGRWAPAVDIFERGDELLVRAEVPGVDREKLDVSVENGVLVLKGERAWDRRFREEDAHRIERHYGAFARSFTLPVDVDDAKIKAVYRDGVLEVTLPKSERAKPRKVSIQTA